MQITRQIQQIENDWRDVLLAHVDNPRVLALEAFLEEDCNDHEVCPPSEDWFRAFHTTPPDQVKVVIIGQDPYMNGEATGLSFSVKPGYKLTPSARNIVKEITGLSKVTNHNGDFSDWAENGVLMLNTCLTTRHGEAGAHGKKGWEILTGAAIDHLAQLDQPIVYLAWGRWAHDVAAQDQNPNHHVIRTSHPSPLAASRNGKDFPAFLGSGCFEAANQILNFNGLEPVQWTAPVIATAEADPAQESLF
ncbi:uracil-DNA glycosylase [Marinobacter sp.]|uniref:uracil-DNA glycosylase n=1 Tax=Marinobacter sp. TaxID=50741 RepID=UPI0035696A2B